MKYRKINLLKSDGLGFCGYELTNNVQKDLTEASENIVKSYKKATLF